MILKKEGLKMTDINIEKEKYFSDNVCGLIQLEEYKGAKIPLDEWDIIFPLDDIIMAEYVDTDDGDLIKRDGLYLPKAVVEHSWRVCRALLCGPNVKNIKPNDYFMVPSDKGISGISINKDGKSKIILFVNEPRIFCIVKPKKLQE